MFWSLSLSLLFMNEKREISGLLSMPFVSEISNLNCEIGKARLSLNWWFFCCSVHSTSYPRKWSFYVVILVLYDIAFYQFFLLQRHITFFFLFSFLLFSISDGSVFYSMYFTGFFFSLFIKLSIIFFLCLIFIRLYMLLLTKIEYKFYQKNYKLGYAKLS